MTGGWPAVLVLLASLLWLSWLTAPVGLLVFALVAAWLWRRS